MAGSKIEIDECTLLGSSRMHVGAKQILVKLFTTFTKGIKNAPECIVELYKHAGIFQNTREVHREARGVAECFSHFSNVLKNSQVLI